MNRSFRPQDVDRLTQEHTSLLNGLGSVEPEFQKCQQLIIDGVREMVRQEALDTLKTVDVDELNRDKSGIRVKTLKDHGYTNVASLVGVPAASLAPINGISDEGAQVIKSKVDALMDQASKNVKIHLSLDHKTAESTHVVETIYRYSHLQPLLQTSQNLLRDYRQGISGDLESVQKGKVNKLVWWFTSRASQQQAVDSYGRLSGVIGGYYGDQARNVCESLSRIRAAGQKEAWDDFAKNPISYITVLEQLTPQYIGGADTRYGLPDDLAQQVKEQTYSLKGLKCQLRPYQEWGVRYVLHQGKVLLGDEMGLGKTVEAIVVMVALRNTGATHFMVVCPASVLTNWCREIEKFSDLSVIEIHGTNKNRTFQSWLESGGVAVTTYETTSTFIIGDDVPLALLTVDEAHYIKHQETQRSKNVRNIAQRAQRLLFMTGAALENNVDEMISLMEALQPDVASKVKGMEALSAAPEFRARIASVYYRRKREDVLTELPEKTETKEWCTLNEEEKKKYEEAVLNRKYSDARRVSWNMEDLKKSSKAQRLAELASKAKDDGRKIIVFSFFLDTIAKVKEMFGDACTEPINGSVTPQHRQQIIDEFDKAPAGTVLAAQIQSGGTGLNIQSASVVVICEPQFKPSIENQAISRAYRMGQTRDVLVYRLLCENTIEEKISNLLEEKQKVFDAFADQSEAAQKNLELDEATFTDMMQKEADRIRQERRSGENEALSEEKTDPVKP